ncbi:MAG: CBS domain-containing protein [Acidimicrobiales bacterium]
MVAPRDPLNSLVPFLPAFIDAEQTLREAADYLTANEIGSLLIWRNDAQVGIVSERDIVAALARGADPDEVWAADVMTEDLVIARPDTPIVDAARAMLEAGVRHVVVMDGDKPAAVVSMRDLLGPLLDAALET